MNRFSTSVRSLAYIAITAAVALGVFWIISISKPVQEPLTIIDPTLTPTLIPTDATPTETRPTPTPPWSPQSEEEAPPSDEQEPYVMPTLTATQIATLETLSGVLEPEQTWSATSLDGSWWASGIQMPVVELDGNFYFYTELTVTRPEWSRMPWMAYQEYEVSALGYTLPEVLGWSTDGLYMYFTLAPNPDGCGLFTNSSDLRRIELETGEITRLILENVSLVWASLDDPRPFFKHYVMSISPDGSKLAYPQMVDQATQSWVLNLLDLETLQTQQVTLFLPGDQLGAIVWSPDSSQLLVTISHQSCIIPDWTQAIVLIALSDMRPCQIVPPDSRTLRPVEWLDDGRVRLVGGGWEQIPYWLDMVTYDITPGE